MSTDPAAERRDHLDDEGMLHKLGYAQVLFRGMGGFQNFAISFTIISILAGCLTSYFVAFERGGPVAVTWGWLLVGVMSTIIALSMAFILGRHGARHAIPALAEQTTDQLRRGPVRPGVMDVATSAADFSTF